MQAVREAAVSHSPFSPETIYKVACTMMAFLIMAIPAPDKRFEMARIGLICVLVLMSHWVSNNSD